MWFLTIKLKQPPTFIQLRSHLNQSKYFLIIDYLKWVKTDYRKKENHMNKIIEKKNRSLPLFLTCHRSICVLVLKVKILLHVLLLNKNIINEGQPH